jgi:carbamoyltransferase
LPGNALRDARKAGFHDPPCCLLQDGKLSAAAEEERFSRSKHDPSLPIQAFQSCLNYAGLTLPEIDCIAYYEDPNKKAERQLWMSFPEIGLDPDLAKRIDPNRPAREIPEKLGDDGKVEYFDHHHSHAASAFYCSEFSEAAIPTVDGVGEWATTTYGFGQGRRLRFLKSQISFPNTLGMLYSTITSYLGFDVNDGGYKVISLAPYGKSVYVPEMRQLIESCKDGQFQLNLKYFDFLKLLRMY